MTRTEREEARPRHERSIEEIRRAEAKTPTYSMAPYVRDMLAKYDRLEAEIDRLERELAVARRALHMARKKIAYDLFDGDTEDTLRMFMGAANRVQASAPATDEGGEG